MARSNQGGSILSFLIIGGILAVLLIGGAYFVQQRTSHPAAPAPAPTTTQPSTQPSAQSNDKDKKVAEEPKKDTPAQEAPKKESPTPATPPAAELPKTGATETISSVLGVGLLSGVIVAYVRSRRSLVAL